MFTGRHVTLVHPSLKIMVITTPGVRLNLIIAAKTLSLGRKERQDIIGHHISGAIGTMAIMFSSRSIVLQIKRLTGMVKVPLTGRLSSNRRTMPPM